MKIKTSLALASALPTPEWLHATMVVNSSPGFTLVWDGNDGDGFNPAFFSTVGLPNRHFRALLIP